MKKINKRFFRVFLTIMIVQLVIFLYISLPWVLIGLGVLFSPNPDEPAIKNAEFPFELTYKINEEIITISDVYVCEYNGIGMNEGAGKYRKWKGYIKGTGEDAILITEDKDRKIYCGIGDASYYMNDEYYPTSEPLTPWLYDIPKDSLNSTYIYADEIPQLYHIELISWQLSEPIKNTFE